MFKSDCCALDKLGKDRNINQLNFKLEQINHIYSEVQVIEFIWNL